MAGVASIAAAISVADRNFNLVIQLLHLMRKANGVWLPYGGGEVIRSIKEQIITSLQRRARLLS
jgi:ribonuclease HIII